MGACMTIPQVLDNKTGRSQTAATALRVSVAAPVRARIIKIQADRLGQCERLRRAVDCAPYLTLYAFGQVWRAGADQAPPSARTALARIFHKLTMLARKKPLRRIRHCGFVSRKWEAITCPWPSGAPPGCVMR